MSTLQTIKRDSASKVKKLRREGLVPGCVYGKNFDPSLMIQIPEKELQSFFKTNSIGSTVTVEYEGKKINTILKEVTLLPLSSHIEHISFQELIKGNKVIGTAKIILDNKEFIKGQIKHILHEIQYKAIPEYLFDEIHLDLSEKKIGDTILLSDIPELNSEHIELLIPADSMVVDIAEIFIAKDEDEEEDAEEVVDIASPTV